MSDFLEKQPSLESKNLIPKHDSTDDFEHLENELQQQQQQHFDYQQQPPPPLLDLSGLSPQHFHLPNDDLMSGMDLLDTSVPADLNNVAECDLKPVPATPPPSAEFDKFITGGITINESQLQDAKTATMAFMNSEKNFIQDGNDKNVEDEEEEEDEDESITRSEPSEPSFINPQHRIDDSSFFDYDVKSSTLPEPEKSPEHDFVKDELIVREATREKFSPKYNPTTNEDDELWNVLEKDDEQMMLREKTPSPPMKPLPPLPKEAEREIFDDFVSNETGTVGKTFSGFTQQEVNEFTRPEPILGDVNERKVFCAKPTVTATSTTNTNKKPDTAAKFSFGNFGFGENLII